MDNGTLARYGRLSIWFLIAFVALEGVLGHWFLPSHYEMMAFFGQEYADHDARMSAELPLNDFLHRLLGLGLLVMGALQFDAGLRRSRPRLHRWIGRSYLLLALIVIASGIVFALKTPFAGGPEVLFIALVSSALLFMLGRAWMMALRRDFALHREWMMRGYALFMFIAVQRLLAAPFLLLDWSERDRFIFTAWLAVLIVMVSAETWINLSRRPTPAAQGAVA